MTFPQDEEGIATSHLFTESGLIGLLEQAATMFREVHITITW